MKQTQNKVELERLPRDPRERQTTNRLWHMLKLKWPKQNWSHTHTYIHTKNIYDISEFGHGYTSQMTSNHKECFGPIVVEIQGGEKKKKERLEMKSRQNKSKLENVRLVWLGFIGFLRIFLHRRITLIGPFQFIVRVSLLLLWLLFFLSADA